jgi:hypothetical protein
MICKARVELPEKYGCRKCGAEKLIAEMVLVHRRRTHDFLLRPRCKACHNKAEKGHRRAYKTKYLRRWRRANAELNRTYWKERNARLGKPLLAAKAAVRFRENHFPLLIQARLRRKRIKVSIGEAKRLYRKYGCCYPLRAGLTPWALRECERIRSGQRRLPKHERHTPTEIRMMMYEDGHFKKPARQQPPNQVAAARLRKWQRLQKELSAAGCDKKGARLPWPEENHDPSHDCEAVSRRPADRPPEAAHVRAGG